MCRRENEMTETRVRNETLNSSGSTSTLGNKVISNQTEATPKRSTSKSSSLRMDATPKRSLSKRVSSIFFGSKSKSKQDSKDSSPTRTPKSTTEESIPSDSLESFPCTVAVLTRSVSTSEVTINSKKSEHNTNVASTLPRATSTKTSLNNKHTKSGSLPRATELKKVTPSSSPRPSKKRPVSKSRSLPRRPPSVERPPLSRRLSLVEHIRRTVEKTAKATSSRLQVAPPKQKKRKFAGFWGQLLLEFMG